MTPELSRIVSANGYTHARELPDGRVACVLRLIYTAAIIILDSDPGQALYGYEDRWCYHTPDAAAQALAEWNGEGEPQGWHRHPSSGRRREAGDPATEYVNH